ncbi:MAG: quinone oxidoreductase [Acidimicrobiia bacterium]|nr:quinone oxidoreductase [Acidimicrobiia bacterium]
MHAILMTQTGGPEVFEWVEVPVGEPGAGEIRVTVAAAGVNYIDTYHRRGIYPVELPLTPGLEGAGTVSAVGPEVSGISVGDPVAWSSAMGSYAEEVVLPAAGVVPVPPDMSLEVAAAAMLQGMTAHYLATSTFPLRAGHRCLIHAGAGGVGRILIQLAKIRGAEVFTTVSTEAKAALAESAGADHVIRYGDEDFATAVETIAGPKALDVIYDGVGASTFDAGLGLLKPRGLMALFGQSSGVVPPFDLGRLASLGSLYVTRPTLFSHIAERPELLRRSGEVFEWIQAEDLDIHIGHHWQLSAAADAHRALEARQTSGKVLLLP